MHTRSRIAAFAALSLVLLAACGGAEVTQAGDAGRPLDAVADAAGDGRSDAAPDLTPDLIDDAGRDALGAVDVPEDRMGGEDSTASHDALDAIHDAPIGADAPADAASADAPADVPEDVSPDAAPPDGGAPGSALRVMTFNIRFDAGGLGSLFDPNGWENLTTPRRDRVVAVLTAQDPDLFGVQEALSNQLADLAGALPAYAWYGVGRDDGVAAGEFSALFWRAERFTLVESGTFWLSETPEQPGTSFPGALPRLASWVILDDAATGRRLFWLNTHWDHAVESARLRSAYLIRERLEPLSGGLPVVLTGDFNTGPDTMPIEELRAELAPPARPLRDGYRLVYPVASPEEATYHNWTGATFGVRIDFVFHTDDFTPAAAAIDHSAFDGQWPSDHFPVIVTLGG